MVLFIDTHASKTFAIALLHEGKKIIRTGADPSIELINTLENMMQEINCKNIEEIIYARGPGSLTGLRIGSSFALGLALGYDAKIQGIAIWDIILDAFNADIFFYTGTKKWVKKNKSNEIICEIDEIIDNNEPWISNNAQKLADTLNMQNNIPYPNIIELMMQKQHLATENTELIYNINLFDNSI